LKTIPCINITKDAKESFVIGKVYKKGRKGGLYCSYSDGKNNSTTNDLNPS